MSCGLRDWLGTLNASWAIRGGAQSKRARAAKLKFPKGLVRMCGMERSGPIGAEKLDLARLPGVVAMCALRRQRELGLARTHWAGAPGCRCCGFAPKPRTTVRRRESDSHP